ncbi:MAG TPA: zinc ribbon domain-containing protein [Steroidobacteraceae bacterium]
MPFYEYECPACKYYAEVLQKLSDKPLAKCPSCGKKGFKRLMSAPVFRLKGSGWYETDFKSGQDNQRNLAGAEREEAKPATEAKGGDKPEAKTPAHAGTPGAEKAKAEAAAAKADKADKTAGPAAAPSSASAQTSRGSKRAGTRPAPTPTRAAAKRRAKGAPRRAIRRGRRR